MIPDAYVWPVWAAALLVPWGALFWLFRGQRKAMLWASFFTLPFGLTEPLFVPEYWDPPSLFDLARRTGFDIESLVFCFGIGGVGAALYNVLTGRRTVAVTADERAHSRHRFHRWALAGPFLAFPFLLVPGWNAIYAGLAALFVGSLATVACRPDLWKKVLLTGVLFLGYYLVFLTGLELSAPGFIERVWNLEALTGIRLWELPIEELLFAVAFGTYWGGVYEHFTWRWSRPPHA